jgi:hypothetical protein
MHGLDYSGPGKGQVAGFANAVMNFRSHKMRRIFRPAEELLASQEGPFSMELVSFFCFKCFCCVKDLTSVLYC